MKIGIDAAHGGTDFGAWGLGRVAKEDNLRLALALRDALGRCGAEVVLTRETDCFVSDGQRAVICNEAGVDMVLSLDRGDEKNGDGLEFWVGAYSGPAEVQLFTPVVCEVVDLVPLAGGGIQRGYPGNAGGDYRINRNTLVPSMLVKILSVENKEDNTFFDGKLAEIAEGFCKGICRGMGAEYVLPVEPERVPVQEKKSAKK